MTQAGMLSPLSIRADAKVRALCRTLGICMFLVSFLLPASRTSSQVKGFPQSGSPVMTQGQFSTAAQRPWTLRGIHCAVMSLMTDAVLIRSSAHERSSMSFWMYLVALAGWTNPLILVFLPLCLVRRAGRAQRAVVLTILLCLVTTVVFFIFAPFVPLVGYFAWLIGILMIIYPAIIPATACARGASGTPAPPYP